MTPDTLAAPARFDAEAFDALLEDLSRALLDDDLPRWRSRSLLPFSLVTATGPVVLSDETAVAADVALYRTAMRAMGLTRVVREPPSHETCEDGTVLATYRTHLLSDDKHAAEPDSSPHLLHPGPDGWRMGAILNARSLHARTGVHPNPSGETR